MQEFLTQIIRDAGALAKEYFYRGVTHKSKSSLQDLVTEADYAVSDFLIEKIRQRFPDHSITSEEVERTINPGGEYEWLIDPIDGTRNFAMGVPIWCIIVAVLQKGEPVLGAVYAPIPDELFFGKLGHGATLNSMPIWVSDQEDLEYAMGHFSRMPESTSTYGVKIDRYKQALDRLNRQTHVWIHQFGCMLGMCYLASGGIDFMTQNAGLDHDYVAPVLIAREAGAKATNAEGEEWQRGMQDIVVANPTLHAQVMEQLFAKK